MFYGCATAIITPFKENGEIDEEGLRELVAFQEEQGIDAIVPCGTTGESATLTHEEHVKVIEIVVDHARKAKVIAGAGSNATHEAIYLSRAAKDLGVDGILSISPYYNKPTQKGIFEHYERIAQAVDLPIIIYNVPSRTGSNIEVSTVVKLAEIPNIVGIKEASGNIVQVMNILAQAPKGFVVLSGDDVLTYPMMTLGAKGVVSVASNVVPSMVKSMVDHLLAGDWEEARKLHFKLLPLFKNLFIETNPIPVKTSLRLMGKPAGSFRLPLCEMNQSNLEILRRTLLDLGVISK
ncbi:MAG: 4-hydroxy-tetrahydrodipicolinate synthase [Methanomassiliicoccales archaeon]|jgi:4-hydroxy-tetrahydrodipicolinate synthase|nr:4-hydroxy-tetrahydrodipicolinate synthase [Methanomassiliicoccales archaeon]